MRIVMLSLFIFVQALGADKQPDVISCREVSEVMKKAAAFMRSIATKGGYCGIYSLDLKKRYGEATYERAQATEIWVQPPGTPSVGRCWLEAYRATGDEYYLDAARDVAKALVWGQRRIGGWDHRVDLSHMDFDAEAPKRKKGRCTFDDNITQGALSFLIDADSVLDAPWLDGGIELGLSFMIKSQFENGAWPQWYPLRGGYHDYYTYNDRAINDCISLMLKAHKVYNDETYRKCAEKGGSFIIASQGKPPQAGWAQQYSHDMKPAWARRFEPPGICSAATASNMRTLIELYRYTEEKRFLKPLEPAISWLERSEIRPGVWARLYETGTNRPVYGDRENGSKVFYDYKKISKRERSSYGWQGEYGIRSTIARCRRILEHGIPKPMKTSRKTEPLTEKELLRALQKQESSVRSVIKALDSKGRWISGDTITSRTFVRNFSILCRYAALFHGL